MALFLTEEEVTRLLDMPAAIEAVEGAFRELGVGRATTGRGGGSPCPKGCCT